MRKVSKRKYDLKAFLVKKGISQRILAELLGKCRPLICQWANDGSIPLDQLARIVRLTKTELAAKAKWTPFDVAIFRKKWSLTTAQLARELTTSQPNIRNWEAAKKIPRAYLGKIRKVNEWCRCRKPRRKKKK